MRGFGFTFILVMSALAVSAPWIFPYDPHQLNLAVSLQGPSFSHIFGLDENGQDLFIKIFHGARISLTVTGAVIAISLCIGLFFGTLAGLFPGRVDRLISGLVDMTLAFPKFLLALALLAMIGPSTGNLIFALSFSTWAGFARLIRGEVRHLKTREFVLSSKAFGGGGIFLLRKHIYPNLLGLLAVHGMFQSSAVLIAESGLSFLGLAGGADTPSWGGLLNSGRRFIMEAPHLSFFPGLFLCLFLLSLNFFGDGLRERFDPRHNRT